MAEGRARRRLAAILAADVVGYSRLIRADEEGTLDRFKALRQGLIDPKIAGYQGRIFKQMGDGLLVEFASVVDAVRAAAEVQQAMAERNAGMARDDRIEFRVGINLGDVVIDGDDIHGDGVNVAARMEGLAEPGGICISGAVYEQVRDRLDLAFQDLGEQQVKNIDRPVRVWRWAAVAPAAKVGPEPPSLPDRPSIAVLPFDNMSGDPEQEYFADGITEDIITDLSKVSGLFVIARNSSFAYKGRNLDLRQVCRELGVRHLLEGSVRKAGNRVRINAQMIDGATGGHLWAERYDRDLEDIFAVQDEVTRNIVDALKVALTAGEKARREGRRRVDPEAYDCLARARKCFFQFSADAMVECRAMAERASDLDPGFAPAYALQAVALNVESFNVWNDPGPDHLTRALELARRACATDPHEPQAYHALALAHMWLKNLDDAERAAERALELDANFAGACTALSNVRDYCGRHESAIELAERALRLDPQYDMALQFLGRAQFGLQRYDAAEATFKRRLILSPRSDMTRAFLAAIYGHTGRHEEARRMWRDMLEINPDYSVEHLQRIMPYRDPAWFDRFVDGLRKAGIPD
jgi:adenylate cyclase